MSPKIDGPFPSARDDAKLAEQVDSNPAYRLAFKDEDFILRDDLRAVRLQLEQMKPEILLREHGIRSTVAVFGSARIPELAVAEQHLAEAESAARAHPDNAEMARKVGVARRMLANARYYQEARRLGEIVSTCCTHPNECDFVILTGGGPGIMEAANRGAHESGAKSVALNIVLPMEQKPNPFVTPELSFRFHYFAMRKMHFLHRAKALVVFPGGFGTLDEMFEAATLMQTGKIERIPFLLFGKEYWERVLNLDTMVSEGMISPEDKGIFQFVETAEEAWHHIATFWSLNGNGGGAVPAPQAPSGPAD
ncbi:putative lysine decarboxylase [mine drainage metagenome]|uniref:Putative lysine decarboxylase n=1 Tax=mine drainage metagenome TaxID=410659 RepID=A0A1J5S2J8_9ZZZZ